MSDLDLIDVQERWKESPEQLPSKENIDRLTPGDFVKIISNGERFWVVITNINDDKFQGTVDNYTVSNDLDMGDAVEFEKKHITETKKRPARLA